MTKSTITRERLQEIADDGFLKHGESKVLARMALAAMNSEPEYLPLDYLQGHRDGLEWSARLAESNHPETGDWLYDDPIELAKAIRKGPDMPPAQPVADSEPDRNPVLAYADSYRDMAKQGVESVPIWSVITDLERNIAPLYRHAQTVVPATLPCSVELKPGLIIGKGCKTETLLTALRRRADYNAGIDAMTPEERAEYDANIEAFKSMLPQPAPVVPEGLRLALSNAGIAAPESDEMLAATQEKYIQALVFWVRGRKPFQPSAVVPDDYQHLKNVRELYHKQEDRLFALARRISGESFDKYSHVPSQAIDVLERTIFGDEGDACRAAMLAAAPHDTPALNSLQSVDSVAGKWIPVSERMPENKPGCYEYLVFETLNNRVNHDYWNAPDKGDDAFTPFWNYYGGHVTHWMPLPAAPQEVSHD